MKSKIALLPLFLLISIIIAASAADSPAETTKPTPEAALTMLKDGNQRFSSGQPQHPNSGLDRLELAGKADQADYAIATVLACSDSRVPVELLFDAGIMDLFVVRVAGNVCRTDEIGSIEYGLVHVKTPVLVILGHSHCGAVTAVTREILGNHHDMERSIAPLISPIFPAVKEAMSKAKVADEATIVANAVEANVWQSMYDLFHQSPAVRKLVKDGKVKVVGAVYDIGAGTINWLPETESEAVLAKAETAPDLVTEAMACEQTETPKPPATRAKDAPVLAQSTAALGQSTKSLPGYLESIQAEVKALRTDMTGLNQTLKTGLGDVNKVMTANMKTLEAQLEKPAQPPTPGASEAVKKLGNGFEEMKKSVSSGIKDLQGDIATISKTMDANLSDMNKELSAAVRGLGDKIGQNQNQALQSSVRGMEESINKQVNNLQLLLIIGIIVLGVLVVVMAFMLRQLLTVRLDDVIARHESLRSKTRQALIGLHKQIR
jgi:carbonic anhydrase